MTTGLYFSSSLRMSAVLIAEGCRFYVMFTLTAMYSILQAGLNQQSNRLTAGNHFIQ